MKIKIFSDTSPEELEEHVNKWLESSQAAPVQITTQLNSELKTTEGGSTFWDGWSYVTVLYKEQGET